MAILTEQIRRPVLPNVDSAMAREPWLWVRLGESGAEATGMTSACIGQVDLPAPLQTGRDVYAQWEWDGQEAIVRNCRLGFFPLYYYATDKEFGVSPSIERLLAEGASAELDDAAMAVYLRLGWTLGEDTVFRHIRALPPGGTVRWTGGMLEVSGGIKHPTSLHISREQAIATFADLLRQAVRRRASPEVSYVMPLSGGRDSRSLLLELMELGCRPLICYTNHDFPPYRTQNIEIAGRLAQRFNLPHKSLGQPSSRLAAEVAKNRFNNFCAAENIWCVSLYGEIAKHHPHAIIYEGSPGGTTYSQYCKPEHFRLIEQNHLEELARDILNKWLNWHTSESALQRVLNPAAAARFNLNLALERLKRELTRHMDAPNPMVSFFFWNRGRHVSAMQPFSIARRPGLLAVTPFLDHDLLDFRLALPPTINVDKIFHDAAIDHLHPELRELPYADSTQQPPIESNSHYRRFFIEMLTFLVTQGTGELLNKGQVLRHVLAMAFSRGNLRMRMRWIAPYVAIYLTQIESVVAHANKTR